MIVINLLPHMRTIYTGRTACFIALFCLGFFCFWKRCLHFHLNARNFPFLFFYFFFFKFRWNLNRDRISKEALQVPCPWRTSKKVLSLQKGIHYVNGGVIYKPERKVVDDNLINVRSLQSCCLKPEEIINKEIFYMDDTICFQPKGQDLQFFLY